MAAFSSLYADLFSLTGQQNSSDNDLFTLTVAKAIINEANVWAAEQGCLFTRSHQLPAVDEQATYRLPADMHAIEQVNWYTTTKPLTPTTKYDIKKSSAAWRSASSGTPSRWYKDGGQYVGLYLKPNVTASEYLTLYGYVIPYAIGSSISTIARSTTTMTVTTSAAHGLRVGESVTISGSSEAVFHAAHTIVTVPSTTTFTATVANSGATTATGGYLKYTGGLLPLIADTDVPDFYAGAHDILVQRGVVIAASGILAEWPAALAAAPNANAKAADYLAKLKNGAY